MKFFWLFALCIVLSAQQCAKEIDIETLTNKWGHSHEEDAAGVLVYRPHTFDFPAARGREWFEFKKDGTYIQHDIAPADGNIALPGTWKQDPAHAGSLLIGLQTKPEASYRMEILELTKEVLKFRKVNN
jgi:hypothetical protein